ncbi:MAG: hypothetical protein COW00_12665 [Bdellovibrio sp. CG12_big_fil_rev_8_21_14_0_65_39_13]|nr:MAG: hypothetical protein COW78_06955 [Bdellovibrio sp. CG22_combo_CG10-13_8_21_14_all_39_27]PIQ59036.1 MAG: hypothetical protein COW00_12665 [Bdellovibrio sp. CG12_big_fil_rev_8_21_14_0_65_39_13]PIR33012.1 MAG: hypothetical protein COV37_18125 [Bdellovibrio sp. CG11_big_fil_rev_8_21_14_0_20_39_38]
MKSKWDGSTYEGAFQRLVTAGQKIGENPYPVSHYLFGLAAECALRALIIREPVQSLPKHAHDFGKLYNIAITKEPGNRLLAKSAQSIKMLQLLWKNTDRYESDKKLYQRLNSHNIRGLFKDEDINWHSKNDVLIFFNNKMHSLTIELAKATRIYS